MDIRTVKLFFSGQRIHSGQTFPLFCTSKLIRNLFWLNMLFLPPLHHTPALQPYLRFCSKQAKTSYFDRYARPKPNHNLLRYFFINAVTEHQKSVHRCFPLLESNLNLWNGNRCFTNGLLKCLVPRATKKLKQSCMYKSIPISPPF